MLATFVILLLWVVLFAVVVHLALWVLGQVGVALPAVVVRLVWVAFALLVIIWLITGPLANGIPHP